MLKRYMRYLFSSAYQLNRDNILSLCAKNSDAKILDLGCDDGEWTRQIGRKIGSEHLFGVEIVKDQALIARNNGIDVVEHDLNQALPFPDNYFDVIHANQVIEHVGSVDLFASEIYRTLKPGGYAVISTENASSWHNVFAIILGWQMFSLTNLSAKTLGIGNPLAILRHQSLQWGSWTHKTIFSYLGLIEFLGCHGFKNQKILGSGYYPFGAKFGRFDVRHAHFITAFAVK